MIQEIVDEEQIAKVVSRWTHIEVSKLIETERQKLLHLQDALAQRVIGQDGALELVIRLISSAKTKLAKTGPRFTWKASSFCE